MKHLPKALFFVDGIHERIAISEAKNLGIPTFGIVDSNTDPRNIDFPIPANDDSMKTISLIVNYICDTIIEATGGTAQAEESLESENVPEEGAVIDDPKSEDDNIETKDDSKTIPEKELELVAEDKAASEDAQKENQE